MSEIRELGTCISKEMRSLTTEQYGTVVKTGEHISNLISEIPTNFFIAGGSVIYFLRNENYFINDIDMFFLSKKDRDDTFKWLIKNGWKRQGGNKHRSYWTKSEPASTQLIDFSKRSISKYKLNLIHTIYKNIPECVDSFDIDICSIAYTKTGVAYAHNLGLKLDMIKKHQFHFKNINETNIDSVIKRMYKYCRKEFNPLSSDVRKIIEVLYKDKDYKSDTYEGMEQRQVRTVTETPTTPTPTQTVNIPF